ncbi:hypothetical protein M427DRAFT_28560 [Gonapodya prolifera JEL478]|uniref:Telomerase reverse transcriptase n=1 Tax=Gonapodya prolifera (strain JEL478) TaxID=1344416 RepID=A0A139AUA4_GONPJ|nr:hypothetical protein M427DRAFT_28560 [Gonapodya prolifera JEL478]|eukprot:KXS20287.1 hypothetical protein M427DRAFT_28560 [Gonapodya prolifera JEL478]
MLLAELFESPPVPLGVFLREHCQFVTQDTPGTSTVQETDPIAGDIEHAPGLSDILERAFVARSLGGRWPPPKAEPGASQAGQGEIGDKSTHCLPGTRSVENYFPNTLVNQVKSPAWEELLGRIGDPLMTYILTSLYIFLPLSNGCWFQLAGMISRDSFGMNHTPIPQVQLATTTTTGNQPPPPPKRGSKKRKRGGLPGLKTRDTTSGKTPSDPFEPEHGKKKRRVGTHPITTAANALPAPSTTAVSEVLMVSPSQVAAASKKRKRHTPKRKKVQTGDGCTSEDVSRNPTLPSPSESSVRDPAGIEDIVHGRQAAILPMGDGVVEVAAVTSATDAALQGQNRNPSNASESGMDLDEFGDCDEFDMDLDWDLPVLPPNLASHPEGNTMASDMGTPTTRIVEPPGEPRVGDGNKPGVTVKGFFECVKAQRYCKADSD